MEKLIKQMTIGITDDGRAGVNISPDMDAATALQLLGTLAGHILEAYYTVATQQLLANSNPLDSVPNQSTKKTKLTKSEVNAASIGIKESMYDAANCIFSTVLSNFYPDAPRLSLEDEAILELTNKKIEQRYYAMSPKDREQYKQNYDRIKAALAERVEANNNESSSSETTED